MFWYQNLLEYKYIKNYIKVLNRVYCILSLSSQNLITSSFAKYFCYFALKPLLNGEL